MTIVVLGGGIGGLSTAYYLLKNTTKHKIILLEASNRLGGWIRSDKQANGLIFEQGPRTLRPVGENGANTLNLIEELDLPERVNPILSNDPVSKNRFIYVNKQLYALPSSLGAIFKTLPPFSKPLISAVKKDLFTTWKHVEDDSLYNFVARRFGQEIADYAISSLVCGICGGDAKRISVNFLMKDLFEKEQKYGSVTKGFLFQIGKKKKQYEMNLLAKRAQKSELWSSYNLIDGMEILPQILASKIEQSGVTIMKNNPVLDISLRKKVVKTKTEEIPFKYLVSTLPTYSLSKLVHDEHYPLYKELAKIPYASVITVNLAYSKKVLHTQGFGFLVPPAENLPILGIVFDSCYAPFGDWTVLTVMMGGHSFDTFFKDNCSDDYILKTARKYVADILKIDSSPDLHQINVLRNCIPQQIVGHNHRITAINNYIEYYNLPLYLVGTAFKGTGINDTILAAKNAAETIDSIK